MSTNLKNVKNTNTVNRQKISVKTVKLSGEHPGFTFRGIYRGIVLGTPFNKVDPKTFEVMTSQLINVVMEDLEGDRTAYLADKGLTEGLNNAMVQEGHLIEVVKLPKANISKGRTMNQYDIFALESLS